MDYTISLGGSLIVPEAIDVQFLKRFQKLVLGFKDARFIIVAGGGKVARAYQHALSELIKADDQVLDLLGIAATKLNAELIRALFSDVAEKIIIDPFEKVEFERILIASGWKPGRSTDYVAVQLAKNYGCDTVINMTNVDYIYDKNPKEKNAKKLSKISFEDLKKIMGGDWKPGMHTPFDPEAAKFAWEEKKRVVVLGKDVDNLKYFLEGKKWKGTEIE